MISQIRNVIESMIADKIVDTNALYPGKVVLSRSDGTHDVILDDTRFGSGMAGIPIRTGLPGCTTTLPVGARVAVGFEGGKRSRPAIMMFESGIPVTLSVVATTMEIQAGTLTIQSTGDTTIDSDGKITLTSDGDAKLEGDTCDLKSSTASIKIGKVAATEVVINTTPVTGQILFGGDAATFPVVIWDAGTPKPSTIMKAML